MQYPIANYKLLVPLACVWSLMLLAPLAGASVTGTIQAGTVRVSDPWCSGTNCIIQWGASCTGAGPWPGYPYYGYNYIDQIDVWVDGEEAASYFFNDKSGYRDGSLHFDSTHFAEGTPISLLLVVSIQDGTQTSITGTKSTYNKAFCLGNGTIPNGLGGQAATSVGNAAGAMNHSATVSDARRNYNILGLIPDFSVFYSDTHSSTNTLSDCYDDGNDPSGFISDSDIATAVSAKTSQPGFNFVHLDGCHTAGLPDGEDTWFCNAFRVTGTDKGMLGWRTFILINQHNNDWTERYWNQLKETQTIFNAYVNASVDGWKESLDDDQQGQAWGVIQGDPQAKVHGVYLGPLYTWYRRD